MSYGDLMLTANHVAGALMDRGVKPGDIVGIVLPLCLQLIPSILGVLKAGAAYLPLHYADPTARILSALREARVIAVITTQDKLDPLQELALPVLDAAAESARKPIDHLLPRQSRPSQSWIYAIHTSGSTGVPKCATVRYLAFSNLVDWCIREFQFTPSDRTLVLTSPAFDQTQKNLFAPLLSGGVVVLAPGGPFDPEAAVELMESHRISLLNCAPAMFSPILESAAGRAYRALHSLRWVIFGGEPLRTPPLRTWLSGTAGHTRIANEYGPSECTDVVAWYAPTSESEAHVLDELPIGRPLPGARLQVCDQDGRWTPIGVPGELHIGGAVTGDGYLNDHAASAARFRPDPAEAGARMYATGDLVRVGRQGLLEYIGREDDQVKVRGQRVELGEVASLLRRHGEVASAVVVQRSSNGPLVAYFEPKRPARPSPAELAAFLRHSLPEPMIPTAFVALERLPLNGRGKIDKSVLPPPNPADMPSAALPAAVLTPREESIAAIWSVLLGLDPARIGRHDRFFDLGGHSLLAAQLVARIRETFPPGILLRQFFEDPTVAGIAAHLGDSLERPVALRSEAAIPQPLSFPQLSLWLAEQLGRAPNVTLAWKIEGALDLDVLTRSLDVLVEKHASLRTAFRVIDATPMQVVEATARLVPQIIDLGPHGELEALQRVQAEGSYRFDVQAAPLARAQLLGLGAARHVLILTLHHLIADGWSLGKIVPQLVECYRKLVAGQAPALPEIPLTYVDFALWQHGRASQPAIERQLSYWERQLQAPRSVLTFPGGDPSAPARVIRHQFEIDGRIVDMLRSIGRQLGATLFMTLLAGFQSLLSHATRVSDVIVGTDFNGRAHPDLAEVVGFFVNQVILRTSLDGDPTFREIVGRARRVTLAAQQNQEAAFEHVQSRVRGVARAGIATELFQAKFAFQEAPEAVMEIPGLHIAPFGASQAGARFPLLLIVRMHAAGALATLDCDRAAMSESFAALLAADCKSLLEVAAEEPDLTLSRLRERMNRSRRLGASVSRERQHEH